MTALSSPVVPRRRALLVVTTLALAVACGAQRETAAPPTPSATPSSPTATTTSAPTTPSATSRSATPAATATRTATATTSPPRPPSTGGVPTSLLGTVVTQVPTSRKVAVLTFDAGANGDGVASILATLRRERVPATFFLTGDFATRFPTLARAMASDGAVGAHTVTHPHLPQLSDAAVRTEVSDSRAAILRATGAEARPLFRFPYGESSPRCIALVNALGFLPIGWTYGSPGYLGTSGHVDVDTVVARLTGQRTPGEILLMHVGSNPDDGSTLDADALPRVITTLRAAGWSFASLSVTDHGVSAVG